MTNRSLVRSVPTFILVSILAVACTATTQQSQVPSGREFGSLISSNAHAMIEEGRQTFAMTPSVTRDSGATLSSFTRLLRVPRREASAPVCRQRQLYQWGSKLTPQFFPKNLSHRLWLEK